MLKIDLRPYVVCIAASMFMASSAPALPTNGDFSVPDLDGWTVTPTGTVTDDGGYALFVDDPYNPSEMSLSQGFILPAGTFVLSFDRRMNSFYDDGGTPTTDTFTVSLLDSANTPLVSYGPGKDWFYSVDTSVGEQMVPEASVSDIGDEWRTVTLNFSLPAETDVLLAFKFATDPDGWLTTVKLDNVNISDSAPIVPAPAALALGFMGTGLMGLLRRTKTIK